MAADQGDAVQSAAMRADGEITVDDDHAAQGGAVQGDVLADGGDLGDRVAAGDHRLGKSRRRHDKEQPRRGRNGDGGSAEPHRHLASG